VTPRCRGQPRRVGAALRSAAWRPTWPAPKGNRMNAINLIRPYRHHGMWVFDDARVGLVQEPFVAGADSMIDRVVADIPDAERGFAMLFSADPFPAHQYRLDRGREDGGGNWYRSEELAMEGWLCPALFRYFDSAPESIYVQVRPAG
jgi:hypothetical protein